MINGNFSVNLTSCQKPDLLSFLKPAPAPPNYDNSTKVFFKSNLKAKFSCRPGAICRGFWWKIFNSLA